VQSGGDWINNFDDDMERERLELEELEKKVWALPLQIALLELNFVLLVQVYYVMGKIFCTTEVKTCFFNIIHLFSLV
jgi:hypothetical protein